MEPETEATHTLYSKRVKVPDDVFVRLLGGEAVIMNLESESYFHLDDVGTRIWALLTESSNVHKAYIRLLDEYDIDAEQLRTALIDFIHQLAALGLIAFHDGENGTSHRC